MRTTRRHDGPAGADAVSPPRQPLSRRDVYLEQELLQIVFAHPSVVGRLRDDFACEELQDPQLRKLLVCCYGIMDAGEEPTFHRVMAELEDSALKGIAVSLDEEARQKGIGAELLEQTLACLRERHHTDAAELSGQLQERGQQPGGGLNDETAAMLRRLSEYNLQRTVKNKLA